MNIKRSNIIDIDSIITKIVSFFHLFLRSNPIWISLPVFKTYRQFITIPMDNQIKFASSPKEISKKCDDTQFSDNFFYFVF